MIPFEYLVIPILCAAAGIGLGILPHGRRSIAQSITLGGVAAVVGAVAELIWHEASRLQLREEPRVVIAMAIALAVPTFLALGVSWFATRKGRSIGVSALVSAVAVAPSLVLFPWYELVLLCYIGHDCI